MITSPRSASQTFWADGAKHDGGDPSVSWPILRLAQALVYDGLKSTSDDLPGTLFNLWNAEREAGAGVLRFLDVADDQTICVGFLSWGRISLTNFARIEREDIRVIPQEWYSPNGAVAFITEALSYAPKIMQAGLRHVAQLPGVQILCGWRKGRFSIIRVRRMDDGQRLSCQPAHQ